MSWRAQKHNKMIYFDQFTQCMWLGKALSGEKGQAKPSDTWRFLWSHEPKTLVVRVLLSLQHDVNGNVKNPHHYLSHLLKYIEKSFAISKDKHLQLK